MANNREIERAIKMKVGIGHICVYAGSGVCRFYSDDEAVAEVLATLDTETIYLPRLNCQDAEAWADDFVFNINTDHKRNVVRKFVAESNRNKFVRDSAKAIDISNQDVEKNGLWADELRVF